MGRAATDLGDLDKRLWQRSRGEVRSVRDVLECTANASQHATITLCAAAVGSALALLCAAWLLGQQWSTIDGDILMKVRTAANGNGAGRQALREAMIAVTALGAIPTLSIVLLGACRFLTSDGKAAAARRLVLDAGLGMLFAAGLKQLADRARPEIVAHLVDVGSRSFPSGHAADSAIVYLLLAGMISDRVGRPGAARYVQSVAVLLILLIGASRIYLGVHWPTDVVAGWAFGGAWAYLCGLRPLADANGALSFREVTVFPTQGLLRPPFMLFRGGPDWPAFWLQRQARNCRFTPAIPFDVRPRRSVVVNGRQEPSGIWCGPVCQHFGHAIATFGTRLPVASRLIGNEPVVFSARPNEEPPRFFWEMLAYFGIAAERVRIVRTPTVFGRLSVVPQAERKLGGRPSANHLDLLDALSGSSPQAADGRLYVSRAGMWKGKVAGELYLETMLAERGFATFRPENHSLAEQLAAYRRATHLVFAEGSALHALQLLGRIDADVTVIVRRTGARLARAAIQPRVASLRYVEAVRGLVGGLDGNGRPQPSAGMTIVDDEALVAALDRGGVAVGDGWDRTRFLEQQALDLRVWVEARLRHPLHSGEEAAVRRSLTRLGLTWPV